MTQDPVCQMEINEQAAEATSTYRGQTYSFCSQECKEQFDQNPEKYTS